MAQTLTLTISRADQARDPYFYVPFDVPPGTTRLDVRMAYDKAEDCIIDLGCVDPRIGPFPSLAGFRGWSGGARENFFIATDDATPGYVPGAMPPGIWQVVLGLYRVPEAGAVVDLEIVLDDTPRETCAEPVCSGAVREGAGWYKGDLHCHTYHSDAKGSPETLHAAARQAGLDFLAVADHNTVTQRRYFHPATSPDMIFVRAMEITTAAGHANVFGVDDWIDFRMTRPGEAHAVADLVHERGGLLSINHDKPPIPWTFEMPDADCMEVWQSAWLAENWVSLARWQAHLVAGRRLSAIGGSDFHQPESLLPEGPLVLARPTTMLWLEELSEVAILAAMKAGRGYVTEGPDGPHLDLRIGKTMMGGTVPAGPITAEIAVERAEGDVLLLLDATGEVFRATITSANWSTQWSGTPRGFLRAEIEAEASVEAILSELDTALEGRALPEARAAAAGQKIRRALSNPIYLEA